LLVRDELEQLMELQHIDDQLRELEDSKVYLPDMISKIEIELAGWKEKLEAAVKGHEDLSREKKHFELEIEVAQAELQKSQDKMKSIKTNKEYDALTTQITASKDKISALEENLLQTMEAIDKVKEEMSEYKSKHEELDKSNKELLQNLRREIDLIGEKIQRKADERKNIKIRISPRTISHYERVQRGKGGVAVVAVKRKSCGGCHKQLPPQMVQEIKRGDRLLTCDSCGRILLWIGDESQ